ncbi:hypothetical protein [Listeria newyorkensis]|uniref:hypothetical protein n=1 Tax=Listeria newyorkensis TaxID=1497681 RepID=UPI00051D792D|nr:hypothetical protein [Listeria newyorkensis]KGL43567.1 hypothetical protein EP58_07450 [Listeria newyorkensis]
MSIRRNVGANDKIPSTLLSNRGRKAPADGIIQRFVESNTNMTIYGLAEETKISESTLRTANLKPVESLKIPTILSIARVMEISPGNVLDELFEIERNIQFEALEAILVTFNLDIEIADQLAEHGAIIVTISEAQKKHLLEAVLENTVFDAYIPEGTKETLIIQKKGDLALSDENKPVKYSRTIGSKTTGSRSLNASLVSGKDTAYLDLDSQSSKRTKVSAEELKEAFRKPGKRD